MCDIDKMFHQFRVDKRDRNYLRFLWNDEDYRMKVHLFGATSSPGCANYGFKQVANDYERNSHRAAYFIRNFYVDDGLMSVESIDNATKLIEETRIMCAKGNLRLHKCISNSREVMEAIPHSERAKDIKDLSFDNLPIERALGIQWCVESDSFQFRLQLKEQSMTRRGILSTVASVYDPLGFLAPFVLTGKQILQEMCKQGAGWDVPLSDELQSRWERWREDLPGLASVKISRGYRPENFWKVVKCELHHFSDASSTEMKWQTKMTAERGTCMLTATPAMIFWVLNQKKVKKQRVILTVYNSQATDSSKLICSSLTATHPSPTALLLTVYRRFGR